MNNNYVQNSSKDQEKVDSNEFNSRPGKIIWLTGLSGAGKTTIASELIRQLKDKNLRCEHLDGDVFRKELGINLSYSESDRKTNIKIAAYVAKKISEHGVCVVASFISPYRDQRDKLKKDNNNFVEVYIKASLETCIKRDVKGFYSAAQSGKIIDFTGISHPYEEPLAPDIEINTDSTSVKECVQKILNTLWPNYFNPD